MDRSIVEEEVLLMNLKKIFRVTLIVLLTCLLALLGLFFLFEIIFAVVGFWYESSR